MSKQIIIAGYHRSGTSMTTELFQKAGLFVGNRLLGVEFSNPHGHFEDTKVVNIHNSILKANNSSWITNRCSFQIDDVHTARIKQYVQDRNQTHPLWGFKDPRVCLFLDAWKGFIPSMKVVMVFRGFQECWSSLLKRHSTMLVRGQGDLQVHKTILSNPDQIANSWICYNECLLSYAEKHGNDAVLVSHESILQGDDVIRRVNNKFNLKLHTIMHSVVDKNLTSRDLAYATQSDSVLDMVRKTTEKINSLLPSSMQSLSSAEVDRNYFSTKLGGRQELGFILKSLSKI